jgi:hypothetical protein
MRFLTRVVCERVLAGLWGVWETQGLALEGGGLVGVRVRNFISSFEITAWGLKGTKPVPRNPAWAFWTVIDYGYTVLKAIKNSTLVM